MSRSEGVTELEYSPVQLHAVLILLCTKHMVKQHRTVFLTPKGMTIPYFLMSFSLLPRELKLQTSEP